MPPNTGGAIGDLSNDDYVARVLATEARDSSLKYSVQGLEAYMPKRPTGAAPKPNTRFLRNIIRETDNHNTALKRKEEREARERMRQLRGRASSSSTHDPRKQHHSRSQPKSDDRESKRESREGREERLSSHRRKHRSRSASADRERSRKHRRGHEPYGSDDDKRRSSRRERRDRSYSRSRDRSSRDERDNIDSHSRHRRRQRRSSSLSRSRSRSPEEYKSRGDNDNRRNGHRSSRKHRSAQSHSTTTHKEQSPLSTPTLQNQVSGYESDPLEDLVGPLPPKGDGLDNTAPIRSRGRGAYRARTSHMDAHFAPDYDPALDVQLEDDDLQTSNRPTRRPVAGLTTEDDDWELALEALRDRARWKQKGEERLREAGFNDSFVSQWKNNTAPTRTGDDEPRLEDVKWSKKGESREWDRGKFVDEDGHIDVKAAW